jgi:hypothetical protein
VSAAYASSRSSASGRVPPAASNAIRAALTEPVDDRRLALRPLRQVRPDPAGQVVLDIAEQHVLFGLEVAEERAHRDVGRLRDLLDGGDRVDRYRDDLLAARAKLVGWGHPDGYAPPGAGTPWLIWVGGAVAAAVMAILLAVVIRALGGA